MTRVIRRLDLSGSERSLLARTHGEGEALRELSHLSDPPTRVSDYLRNLSVGSWVRKDNKALFIGC